MHFENLSIMAEQIREYTLRYPEGEVAYIKTNEIRIAIFICILIGFFLKHEESVGGHIKKFIVNPFTK